MAPPKAPKAESSSATRLLRLASERRLDSPPWALKSLFSANHFTVTAPLNQNPMHDIITTNQTHTTYLGKQQYALTRLDLRHPQDVTIPTISLGIVTVAPNDATSPLFPSTSPLPGPYSRSFALSSSIQVHTHIVHMLSAF
ncbi:hypothetical protein COCC4DRAFT_25525 [Bipolaris maydis ATCC 48331]|uniref:Uncharacterized protein n=2 Tax=Cochliobolus heterostrophus TaxID=5016 RepID=M2UH54_COCH5|nr:uncharacterized protein COCC4DRAFT_25525 [Bipolaris maydis ATCC 48331]EMD97779.1 hypothetical protein COCHEDRAFT_1026130 [Bipolaris maydis C5]ENI02826.1 hypothetical protein COCC4DRAFT_25525 [Bipolaris maydis ATCC 48331]